MNKGIIIVDVPERCDDCLIRHAGTQNATVFLLWTKDQKGRWACIREYYYSGRDEKKQKTDSEFADDLGKWLEGISPKRIVVDPAAASFIAEMKKRGYSVKPAKNDVLDGIRFVASLLAQKETVFCECCENTIQEFASYVWDSKAAERGEDKPVKTADHCMDIDRSLVDGHAVVYGCTVETLEGRMKARIGDYIIRGVNGELYPCKPDIFQKTYEAVHEP